jgi:hypothetical protein
MLDWRHSLGAVREREISDGTESALIETNRHPIVTNALSKRLFHADAASGVLHSHTSEIFVVSRKRFRYRVPLRVVLSNVA